MKKHPGRSNAVRNADDMHAAAFGKTFGTPHVLVKLTFSTRYTQAQFDFGSLAGTDAVQERRLFAAAYAFAAKMVAELPPCFALPHVEECHGHVRVVVDTDTTAEGERLADFTYAHNRAWESAS